MHSQDNKTLNNVIQTLPNGDHYEGNFLIWILGSINGQLKHGFGVYRYSNGDVY